MEKLKQEMTRELTNRIAPYWISLQDNENGGFFGYVDFNRQIDCNAEKGVILNSRILWFFSAAYCSIHHREYLQMAERAFDFMRSHMLDIEFRGLYWAVDAKGIPTDTRKHTYNQAFGIYALAQYYKASGDKEALGLAVQLFELIEEKCVDEFGYLEEFDRQWNEKENEMLSENEVISDKTMNTHLHVLEAYTLLYEVWKNPKLKERLGALLEIFKCHIYSAEGDFLKVFFDRSWNITLDIRSYGHDIEGTWLLDRAAKVLGDEKLVEETMEYTQRIAESILRTAHTDKGLLNECVKGIVETSRVWWVQAESVVGFVNAYEKTGDHRFNKAAQDQWDFIKQSIIDPEEQSEWFWKVDENGDPIEAPFVEPWKCPYHNGRMCIEIMERVEKHV